MRDRTRGRGQVDKEREEEIQREIERKKKRYILQAKTTGQMNWCFEAELPVVFFLLW